MNRIDNIRLNLIYLYHFRSACCKGKKNDIEKQLPISTPYQPSFSITEPSKNPEDLNTQWKNLSQFLNAWVKVFWDKENKKGVYMLVWVNDDSVVSHKSPVPKSSLIYQYLISGDEDKKKVLEECETILINAYNSAVKFFPENTEVQSGFEIVGKEDFVMSVRGAFGIEIAYPYVDCLIEAIRSDSKEGINILQQFFKGIFAHEMTHYLRNEINEEENTGQEIASHAVQLLVTGGENILIDNRFEEVIKNPQTAYDLDMISALKVLQQKFSQSEYCIYKPTSFNPSELNKTMKSIPETQREKVLQNIAQEIISTSTIDLLRIAAQINVIPFKKPDLEIEKAS